jgi:hypothetical protein
LTLGEAGVEGKALASEGEMMVLLKESRCRSGQE